MHKRLRRLLRESSKTEWPSGPWGGESEEEPDETPGDDGTPEAEFDEIASGGFDETVGKQQYVAVVRRGRSDKYKVLELFKAFSVDDDPQDWFKRTWARAGRRLVTLAPGEKVKPKDIVTIDDKGVATLAKSFDEYEAVEDVCGLFSESERARLRRRLQQECCGECTETEGCEGVDCEDEEGCEECGEQICFESEQELWDFVEQSLGGITEAEKWLQKAIKRPGRCSGDKFGGPDCPEGSPQYNLAKRLKKGGDLYRG